MAEDTTGDGRRLGSMARAYGLAAGWQLDGERGRMLRFATPSGPLLVWADDDVQAASSTLREQERAGRNARESELVAEFEREMAQAGSGARGYYLVLRRRGLSQAFISDATRILGGGVRVPIEFFDSDYKSDQASARAARRSVMDGLLDEAATVRRIAQPFRLRTGLAPGDVKDVPGDLVEHLETAMMEAPQQPLLRFIDGGAGIGKTVAFNAIVKRLTDEFKEAKQQRTVHRLRPIVFLPEHLRAQQEDEINARLSRDGRLTDVVAATELQGQVRRVEELINATISSDMASVVKPEQLIWLLREGYSVWMFDGLDEVYSGDNRFFEFIGRILDAPGSRAQIVLCSRDSLISASGPVRAFLEARLATGRSIEVYELAPWGPAAWTDIAAMELEHGRAGAASSQKVRGFVSALSGSPALAELASLPFYCRVLLDHFRQHGALTGRGRGLDEFDLIEMVVEKMLVREHGKGLFDWSDFAGATGIGDVDPGAIESGRTLWMGLPPEDARRLIELIDDAGRDALLEMMGALAWIHTRTDGGGELEAATIESIFEQSYGPPVTRDRQSRHLLTAMVQFAFFGKARASGAVSFTHPIVADYLAARYIVSLLQREADAPPNRQARDAGNVVRQALGNRPLAPGSALVRFARREAAQNPALAAYLTEARERAEAGATVAEAFLSAVLEDLE